MSKALIFEQQPAQLGKVASADAYRAGALQNLSHYTVPEPTIVRSVQYRKGPEEAETGTGNVDKLSSFYHHQVPLDVGRTSLRAGKLLHDVITFDKSTRSPDEPLTNQVVKQQYSQTYNFFDVGVNQAVVHTQNPFFSVPPAVDPNRLNILMNSLSIERAAKDLGLTLPRAVVTGEGNGNTPTYTDFEALRGRIVEKAANDDYGLRLANMARVVLHSFVAAEGGLRHEVAGAVAAVIVDRKFVAETSQLRLPVFDNGHFVYVGNDVSDGYWAFLTIALLGVNRNVGNTRTVYSRLVMDSELQPGDTLTFVKQTNEQTPAPASAGTKVHVLNNPLRCLSYYYTYAASMGLLDKASAVLRQVAMMPFMYRKSAVLPYKAVSEPKADAYMYLLRMTREDIGVMYNDVSTIVYQSPIVAASIKAGLAATALSYRVRASHKTDEIMAAMKSSLSDFHQGLQTLSFVLVDYGAVTADLEWLNPFSESPDVGMEQCIEAFRDYGWLITTYNSLDAVEAFRPAFETGIDMRNAQFGYKIRNRPFLESLITLSVKGKPWQLENEPILSSNNPDIQQDARAISHWLAVVQWDDYQAGKGVSIRQQEPTPISPKLPAIPAGSSSSPSDGSGGSNGLHQSWRPRSRRTMSGQTPLPLMLGAIGATPSAPTVLTGTEHHGDEVMTENTEPAASTAASEAPSAQTVVAREKAWEPETYAHVVANDQLAERVSTPPAPQEVWSSPRTRNVSPVGTVASRTRSRSRALSDRILNTIGAGKSEAHSRSSSVASKRDSGGSNTGMMLSRGAQETSEIKMVASASESALTDLGRTTATNDGRIALINRIARSHDFGEIVEHMTPGGVGSLDVEEWVGTSADATKRNTTTLSGPSK